jgi:hypothetical protein
MGVADNREETSACSAWLSAPDAASPRSRSRTGRVDSTRDSANNKKRDEGQRAVSSGGPVLAATGFTNQRRWMLIATGRTTRHDPFKKGGRMERRDVVRAAGPTILPKPTHPESSTDDSHSHRATIPFRSQRRVSR